MEVKIGVQHSQRELVLDTEESADDIEKQLAASVAEGGVLSLTDSKGRKVVVPADKLAYLELGAPRTGTVGFR